MKILVTGAFGFIGSHLVERLVKEGNEVTAYDDFSRGSWYNIPEIVRQKIRLQASDVSCESFVLPQVDMVYHLAADSIIETDNPKSYMRNIKGTLNILEQMREKSINKIVFSSSASVYGGTLNSLSPQLFYGASKLACENLINVYAEKYGIHKWIYRFGNIVGGPSLNSNSGGIMNHGCIIDFLEQLRNYNEIRMHGNGMQIRSFVHVEDLLNALVTSADRPCDTYDIANEDCIDINFVVKIIAKVKEIPLEELKIKHLPRWQGDADCCFPDSAKIVNTGWKASMNSKQAVKRAVREIEPWVFSK